MKRIVMTDTTHRSIINLLVELEIFLTIEKSPLDEVKRLLILIKSAENVKVIKEEGDDHVRYS